MACRLLPKDVTCLTLMGTNCITVALRRSGQDYLEWQTSDGRIYSAAEITEEFYCTNECNRLTDNRDTLQCHICTCKFHASPDKPARCPNCKSTDCDLVS